MREDACELLCLDLHRAEALRRARDQARVDRAAARAKALSDPTRLALALGVAEADELCVCDLAWITEQPQNLVSHHLRVLRVAGLVSARREGKMMLYTLTDTGRCLLEAVTGADRAATR